MSLPPTSTSTRIAFAPASMAFSSSSFTTDAGRSTTSPAAILFATASGNILIRLIMWMSFPDNYSDGRSESLARNEKQTKPEAAKAELRQQSGQLDSQCFLNTSGRKRAALLSGGRQPNTQRL